MTIDKSIEPIAKPSTDFDRILAYYQDPEKSVKLTAREEELMKKWECAHDLLQEHGTADKVWPMLAKRYDCSRSTAYRFLKNAIRLFSIHHRLDKEYYRVFLFNKNLEALNRAILRKDSKAEAQLLRNLEKLLQLNKIEEDDEDRWKMLALTQINITMDPKEAGLPEIPNMDQVLAKFWEKKKLKRISANE